LIVFFLKHKRKTSDIKDLIPNPDKLSRSERSGDPARGVAAKPKSRFIGELNIED
jgi:hypothetical protein